MRPEFEFDHELRGWKIKIVGTNERSPFSVSINGVHAEQMEAAPKNERALSETHKSKTFPTYNDYYK